MGMAHQNKEVFLKTGCVDSEISIYEPVELDPGIANIIETINEYGYTTTKGCCSGLKNEHDEGKLGIPYIFFGEPVVMKEGFEPKYYFEFLAYTLTKCGFIPVNFSKKKPIKILIGYLPEKLSDFGVLSKFEALCERLIKRDFFNQKECL